MQHKTDGRSFFLALQVLASFLGVGVGCPLCARVVFLCSELWLCLASSGWNAFPLGVGVVLPSLCEGCVSLLGVVVVLGFQRLECLPSLGWGCASFSVRGLCFSARSCGCAWLPAVGMPSLSGLGLCFLLAVGLPFLGGIVGLPSMGERYGIPFPFSAPSNKLKGSARHRNDVSDVVGCRLQHSILCNC